MSAAIVLGIFLAVVTLAVVIGGNSLWRLHPWVPPGEAFSLGHWRFRNFEFQVWQRKNTTITEPFADGLFVRQSTNQWQVFCFDIQDRYLPKVRLEEDHGQVVVYRDGENRGAYDTKTQTFRRHGQIYEPGSIGVSTNPPGEWWSR